MGAENTGEKLLFSQLLITKEQVQISNDLPQRARSGVWERLFPGSLEADRLSAGRCREFWSLTGQGREG